MSDNMKLWNMLGRTDPAHTKGFTRGGGFKGTAIKPMWSYRRMTEEFGPCGIGWGVNEPTFQVVAGTDGEVLVYCTVGVWYAQGDAMARTIFGVGGDKVVNKFSSGLKSDDEAFKKAFTDAVTNALKLIGVGADVHMGLFDDSKYVSSMREEFSEVEKPKRQVGYREDGTRTPHSLRKEKVWEEMVREIGECKTVVSLMARRNTWSSKAATDKWPLSWCDLAAEEFDKAERALRGEAERQVEEAGDAFPGDRNSFVDNFVNGN